MEGEFGDMCVDGWWDDNNMVVDDWIRDYMLKGSSRGMRCEDMYKCRSNTVMRYMKAVMNRRRRCLMI